MIVRYNRVGGQGSPPDNEGIQVDEDGSFTMWRSIAPVVGRFAGRLDPQELERIRWEADAAREAGAFSRPASQGGSVEMIDVEGAHAALGSHDYGEGPWSALIDHLHRLLQDLIRMPRAAIGLEVRPNGRGARLVHLGTEPLTVDLSRLGVRVVLWGRGYRKLYEWTFAGAVAGPPQVEAAGSWSFALPFDHDFAVLKDRVLHVSANFAVSEAGQRAEVSAISAPDVPQ